MTFRFKSKRKTIEVKNENDGCFEANSSIAYLNATISLSLSPFLCQSVFLPLFFISFHFFLSFLICRFKFKCSERENNNKCINVYSVYCVSAMIKIARGQSQTHAQ